MVRSKVLLTLVFTGMAFWSQGQTLAVLKYGGGGDWYSNPTALPNLIQFCNDNINTNIKSQVETAEIGLDLYEYPYVYMTGHGNVYFSPEEAKTLRTYLLAGGFLHIDDNYGMRPYLENALKAVFPNRSLMPLPNDHPLFEEPYAFPNGLPKIHEHDGLPPQALGIEIEGRLLLLFTFESDLGDGWEDPQIHNDPETVRQTALQMGANIISYVFKN
jgi:hypothetical protein